MLQPYQECQSTQYAMSPREKHILFRPKEHCEWQRCFHLEIQESSDYPWNFRMDSFLYFMGQKRNYQPLWKLVDNLRKLTHRQASVERGFVVNMQLEVENLKEQSYVAQRL